MELLLPIIEKRNLLIFTFLACSSAEVGLAPAFLKDYFSEEVSVIFSMAAILLFGEILPHVMCTNADPLNYAATLAPFASALIKMEEGLVAYPISKIIDLILGANMSQGMNISAAEICQKLLSEEVKEQIEESTGEKSQDKQQIRIVRAKDIMKSYDQVITINVDEIITEELMSKIREEGYSRFPAYKGNPNHVIGLFHVKQFIGLKDICDHTMEELNITYQKFLSIETERDVAELLLEFKRGKYHMGLVTSQNFEEEIIEGIITLEDLLENFYSE